MILVIGYGNTLRSDDGAGQLVAQEIDKLNWKGVRSLSIHQLTPELAEDMATSEMVIFVDAFPSQDRKIRVESLQPSQPNIHWGHTSNPRSLLALTHTLYAQLPPAWWILIPAVNFDFGEGISSVTAQGIQEAIDAIQSLIER
jgi:hydrogenase maturation protease